MKKKRTSADEKVIDDAAQRFAELFMRQIDEEESKKEDDQKHNHET